MERHRHEGTVRTMIPRHLEVLTTAGGGPSGGRRVSHGSCPGVHGSSAGRSQLRRARTAAPRTLRSRCHRTPGPAVVAGRPRRLLFDPRPFMQCGRSLRRLGASCRKVLVSPENNQGPAQPWTRPRRRGSRSCDGTVQPALGPGCPTALDGLTSHAYHHSSE